MTAKISHSDFDPVSSFPVMGQEKGMEQKRWTEKESMDSLTSEIMGVPGCMQAWDCVRLMRRSSFRKELYLFFNKRLAFSSL